MGLHSEAVLHRRFVEFAKLLNTYLNHFPRHEKYALAQEMRRAAYDIYALIQEAHKRYHKKTTLTNLDIRHEQLRMFVALAYELGYFEFRDGARSAEKPAALAAKRYTALSRHVDELGRMIGGWVAAERAKEQQRDAH